MADAQRLILGGVTPLPAEVVSLEGAAGRVLAEPARAVVDLPPFPSSAMDGYAVRAADTPGQLRVAGRIAAGEPATVALVPGEAMEISTGGVVPEGADAVIPVEDVVEHDNEVETGEVAPSANVRPRGGDIQAGEVVADPGSVLTPARLEAAGAVVERFPAVGDDEGELRSALEVALAADVVVTSGGVSVGPHDLVRRVEAELGVEEVFWRVAVKPGKPIAFGVRERTLVFGLPGNPVSALVGFELFVKPAVRALQGVPDPLPRFERGRLRGARRRNPERDELVRARLRRSADGPLLEPLSGQEAHMIARSAGADALLDALFRSRRVRTARRSADRTGPSLRSSELG